MYSPLFNPSCHGGAQVQQAAAAILTLLIGTPSTSQQCANSLRQPLKNSFLTNVTLSHPLSHIPHIPPPSYSHSQFNLLPWAPQPPLAPSPQFNLQHNNSTTISPHLNSYPHSPQSTVEMFCGQCIFCSTCQIQAESACVTTCDQTCPRWPSQTPDKNNIPGKEKK